jgi:hypothetical protein
MRAFPASPISSCRRIIALLFLVLTATAFAADDTAQENRFLSNARQLVFEGKRSGEGYFSPDGKKLIFQSEREAENPFYQQYILDLESGEATRVSPGKGKTTCGFFQPASGGETKGGAGFSSERETAPLLLGLRRGLRHFLRERER